MERGRVVERSGLRSGNARMVGCFGAGDSAGSKIQELFPGWCRVTPPQRAGLSAPCVYASADVSLLTASKGDGSFLVISGRVLDGTSPEQVLETWLHRGDTAFTDLYFHGLAAAWNASSQDFVVLRDQYGVEAGYVAETEHGVLFADDQETLISLGADRRPNAEAIDVFLATGYFPAPLTPYAGVAKVGPGTALRVADNLQVSSRFAGDPAPTPVSFEEALRLAPERFRAALQKTWPSEGSIGLLLSGGVDSALLAVGLTEMHSEPVQSFTFRYDMYDGALNEGDAARVVARHLGMAHDEITISPKMLADDFDAAVAAHGEPLNWGLHSYKLAPLADLAIGTVFSGAGADGTGLAKRHRAAVRFNGLPGVVRSAIRAGVRASRPLRLGMQHRAEWVTRKTRSVGELYSPDSDRQRQARARLYRDPRLADRGGNALLAICEDWATVLGDDDPVRTITVMDKVLTSAEAMLAWNRAWPRENNIEARLPYYDPDWIDLGLNIEGERNGKDLIRALAARSLPNEVAEAPKVAQQMPVSHWLRGPLHDFAHERLSDLPPAMEEIFSPEAVGDLLNAHREGNTDRGWTLISLLTLASWFSHNES